MPHAIFRYSPIYREVKEIEYANDGYHDYLPLVYIVYETKRTGEMFTLKFELKTNDISHPEYILVDATEERCFCGFHPEKEWSMT